MRHLQNIAQRRFRTLQIALAFSNGYITVRLFATLLVNAASDATGGLQTSLHLRGLGGNLEKATVHLVIELKNAAPDLMAAERPNSPILHARLAALRKAIEFTSEFRPFAVFGQPVAMLRCCAPIPIVPALKRACIDET